MFDSEHPNRRLAVLFFLLFLFLSLGICELCPGVMATDVKAQKTVIRKSKSEKRRSRKAMGASLFKANGCGDCHWAAGYGDKEGVVLDGISKRRSRQFIVSHLRNPEEHVEKNAKAFKGDPNLMPDPNLSDREIGLIADYLITLPAK